MQDISALKNPELSTQINSKLVEEPLGGMGVRAVSDYYTSMNNYFSGMGFTFFQTNTGDYQLKNFNSKTFTFTNDPNQQSSDEVQISIPDDSQGQVDSQVFDPRPYGDFQYQQSYLICQRDSVDLSKYYFLNVEISSGPPSMGHKQYIKFKARRYFTSTMVYDYIKNTNSMTIVPASNSYFIVTVDDFRGIGKQNP